MLKPGAFDFHLSSLLTFSDIRFYKNDPLWLAIRSGKTRGTGKAKIFVQDLTNTLHSLNNENPAEHFLFGRIGYFHPQKRVWIAGKTAV